MVVSNDVNVIFFSGQTVQNNTRSCGINLFAEPYIFINFKEYIMYIIV